MEVFTSQITLKKYIHLQLFKKLLKIIKLNFCFGFRSIHEWYQSNMSSYVNGKLTNDAFVVLITSNTAISRIKKIKISVLLHVRILVIRIYKDTTTIFSQEL